MRHSDGSRKPCQSLTDAEYYTPSYVSFSFSSLRRAWHSSCTSGFAESTEDGSSARVPRSQFERRRSCQPVSRRHKERLGLQMNSRSFETTFVTGQPLRVLMVEDSNTDAELSLHALKKHGYTVRADIVSTPDEFVHKLSKAIYDVILSDYQLPEWTGLDVLDQIQKLQQDVPFILVTGALDDATAAQVIDKGADDYIIKDRLGRLPLAVRRLLREKRLLDEMTQVAESARGLPDARIGKLLEWIQQNQCPGVGLRIRPAPEPGAAWTDRRLLIFTEWDDTRRWLAQLPVRLRERRRLQRKWVSARAGAWSKRSIPIRTVSTAGTKTIRRASSCTSSTARCGAKSRASVRPRRPSARARIGVTTCRGSSSTTSICPRSMATRSSATSRACAPWMRRGAPGRCRTMAR